MHTSFDFLPRTWVPGGRSRVAWPPSPGLLGRLQGGGGTPKSETQSVVSLLGFRIEIYVDFDIGFGSFWGRSWVPLGGHFRSCWRLFRPKLVSEPSANQLIFEKVIFHETLRFPMVVCSNGPQDGAKIDPRSLQDGSKIVLGRLFFVFNFRCDF